jgi:hypothetical protein
MEGLLKSNDHLSKPARVCEWICTAEGIEGPNPDARFGKWLKVSANSAHTGLTSQTALNQIGKDAEQCAAEGIEGRSPDNRFANWIKVSGFADTMRRQRRYSWWLRNSTQILGAMSKTQSDNLRNAHQHFGHRKEAVAEQCARKGIGVPLPAGIPADPGASRVAAGDLWRGRLGRRGRRGIGLRIGGILGHRGRRSRFVGLRRG